MSGGITVPEKYFQLQKKLLLITININRFSSHSFPFTIITNQYWYNIAPFFTFCLFILLIF